VLEVNLSSVFRLSQLAGKHIIESGRGGKIVNIPSLLSFQGGITVPAYAGVERRCGAVNPGSDYINGHILVVDGGWLSPLIRGRPTLSELPIIRTLCTGRPLTHAEGVY
jgi:NAD(P)-dependent dehydrogenase (short-subunit alcohol dehydrogenase family)